MHLKRKLTLSAVASLIWAAGTILAPAGTITNNLIVHLPFDNNHQDVSGNGIHGTAVGTPGFGAGKIGSNALTFSSLADGTSFNYVTLGAPPQLNFGAADDFTVAFWVKFSSWTGDPSFVANKNWNSGGNLGWVIATAGDAHLQWNFNDGTGRKDYDGPSGALSTGVWHHVAVSFDRDGSAITYLDGAQVDSRSIAPGGDQLITPDGQATNIGQDGTGSYTDGGGVGIADGTIDDVGIWGRLLSPTEISQVYSFGLLGTNLSSVPDASGPFVALTSPGDNASGVAPSVIISATIQDGTTKLATNNIEFFFDGVKVTPTLATTATNATLTFDPPGLLAALSVHTFSVVYRDTSANPVIKTNNFRFTVTDYNNIVLPAPIVFENFNSVPEGEIPAGWTAINFTDDGTPGLDLNDPHSESYKGWVVISRQRVIDVGALGGWDAQHRLNVAPGQVVNGAPVTSLVDGNFVYAESDVRGGSQVQYLFTPDFDLTGKANIFMSYHSIYTQNQDNVNSVEYSIDGGTNWLPVVIMIDRDDIIRKADGTIDPEATLNEPRGDSALYVDPNSGEAVGGSYGAFLAVPTSSFATLAPFISGRVNDDSFESKRVEIFRLPQADNQAKVRIRFMQAGTASWYYGVDNFGLYSITTIEAPAITVQPQTVTANEGENVSLTVTATGPGLAYQWQFNGNNVGGATTAKLDLNNASPTNNGNYRVIVSNAGGSVTSQVAVVTINARQVPASIVEGLVTHLKFDNSYADSSGNNVNGTAVGNPTFGAGKVGSGALVFNSLRDGTSFNYVTLGTNSLLNFGTNTDFTVSFWAKLATWTGDPPFVANKDWGSGGNIGYVIATDGDGRIQWNYRVTGGAARKDFDGPAGRFSDNNWHHIVVTFQRNGSALTYADGQLINTTAISPSTGTTDAGFPTNIGQDGRGTYTDGGGVGVTDGMIDDVAIWRRALAGSEVQSIYTQGSSGQSFDAAPAGLRITSISDAGNSLTLTWTGGTAPYVIQRKTSLSDAAWVSVATTSDTSATIPRTGDMAFYRVGDKATTTVIPLSVSLSGASERPAVTSPGAGGGWLSLDGNTLTYSISYSNLTSAASAAHIHGPASTAVSAGVMQGLSGASGTAGTLSGTLTLSEAEKTSLLAGQTYVNIHTANNGGGELRGQIMRAQLRATLNGANERPAVTTAATGSAVITLVGNQLTYQVTYSGLSGAATAAHFHGPADSNGTAPPVITLTPVGTPGTSGTYSDSITVTPADLAALVEGMVYVNIHTAANGGGEIRGQVGP
jgi:hypothetical protein